MFKLETTHLILRDMQPADEADFVAISQESKYQRFYSESDCDPDKYRQLTRLFIEQASEHPRTAYQLAIENKATGGFIGTVCLRLEPDRQASMGCGMARAYQGHGLIHEAAYALMDFGFRELDIHRIYAETISHNRAAIRLCKTLGMRQEGHFREHRFFKDQWWDTVVLAVLKSEWQQRSSPAN
jgi:[ribosomal protein S5]-alanine N-acetyltransferase